VVLCEDETDLLLFPPLHAAWMPRGQPRRVLLTGRNAKRVIFGAIDLASGQRLFASRLRQRAADFCAFLRLLRKRFAGPQLVLLLDEDPSHTALESRREAARLRIELIFSPKRCPELNPMESLWRQGKQVVCANRQYHDLLEELLAFFRYLEHMSEYEVLKTAGILSRTFWLRHVRSKLIRGPT
jgi:transposase